MFHTSTSKAVNFSFVCIMYVSLYIFLPFCAWPAHFACSFPAVEGTNREQHHALPKQCSAQLQAWGSAARGYPRAGRRAGKLSHSRFRVPLSQDRRLEIRNSPFPGHLSELRENQPTHPLRSALPPELQIPSHREKDYSSQSALRCSRRGRAKMAAGEEEGSVVDRKSVV